MSISDTSLHIYRRAVDGSSQDSLSLIAALIEPGQSLLDLGMGAGGLGQYLSQRQAVVARLLGQTLTEALDYPHAQESLLATAQDFPTSAAEFLALSLRAARDTGAWEADREVAALKLDAQPQMDFGLTPELALRWLEGKIPMTLKQAEALKDSSSRTEG